MSEAVEASVVVEPYQFEPILTESGRESCDDDSRNSDNGGHNLRSGVPYIFCRGAKVRLIQLLDYLSAAP